MKTAVFVEGQTELIFVRELLLKYFEYQNISIDCYTLFTDSSFNPTEYSFPNSEAKYYFQVINVGNDQGVLTRMLRREKAIWNAGFTKIIGLRDMYSREYREAVGNRVIDLTINQKFIDGHRSQIKSENIFFSFAIMEVEAWLLGLRKSLERMDAQLTSEYILDKLGYDLSAIDPEVTFFHPAADLQKIYSLVGKDYDKSKSGINSLVSHIEKSDYEELLHSEKCSSFKEFIGYLL